MSTTTQEQVYYGNIEPGKEAYERVGKGSTHDLNEAIAELIDNSIEARTESQRDKESTIHSVLEIDIKLSKLQIKVTDNARGMGEKETLSSLRLYQSKKQLNELGGFGIGMKAASLSIGNTLEVITGKEDSDEEYSIAFNIEQWNTDKSLTWNHYPYKVSKGKPLRRHGTTIIISDLRINITDRKIEKLIASIGGRYRGYLEHNDIIIKVNNIPCRTPKIDWREGYPKHFEIETKLGKIHGEIGLMQKSSQVGNFGFDLFWHDRLIMQGQKFGITGHPSHAFILGEIHLDFVPVNQDKNKFRTETEEYEVAEKACIESPIFKEIASASGRAGHSSGAHTKVNEKIAQAISAMATVFSRKERQEELPKEAFTGSKIPTNSMEKVEVEYRNGDSSNTDQEHPGDEPGRERNPRHYHKVLRVRMRNGKLFEVKHEWVNIPGMGRKDMRVEEGVLTVTTNEAFAAFKQIAPINISFYVCENIVDGLAEIYGRDNNYTIRQTYEYRDSLLAEVYDVLNKKVDRKAE